MVGLRHVWMRIMSTLRERLIRKSLPTGVGGCHLWMGAKDTSGYGRIWDSGKLLPAHRVAYELFKNAIPDGLDIDHLCRVRCCVNPDHLEAVTHAENVRRGDAGKHNADKTHCPQGHEYAGENLYVAPNGDRHCRICARAYKRAYKARKRQEANNGV